MRASFQSYAHLPLSLSLSPIHTDLIGRAAQVYYQIKSSSNHIPSKHVCTGNAGCATRDL